MTKSTHSTESAHVTSTNVLGDAQALSAKITALVGPAPQLTATQVAHSAKLRKGGGEVVKTIAALSDKFGLVVPSTPTAPLVAKINQADDLVALHKELVTATKHVADAMFQAQSESWAGATVHYSMLQRLAKQNGDVAKALQPVTQFFAARSTGVKEAEKAARGGARKGSSQAKANRAASRAADEAILANSKNASPANAAPAGTTEQTGPSTQPASTPNSGAPHS